MRRYEAADAADIFELARQDRALLIREFAQLAALQKLQDAQAFVVQKREQWESAKTFCYGIWQKQAREQVGQIQVKNIAWEIPSAELGYFIGAAWYRQGYASESIHAILRLAFRELGFHRIFVRILPSNQASLALAKKLGFQQEGLQRNAFRCGLGELHDVRFLSLTPEDHDRRVRRPKGHSAK